MMTKGNNAFKNVINALTHFDGMSKYNHQYDVISNCELDVA